VRLNGPKAAGKHTVINWVFSDLAERYVLTLENGALTYLANHSDDHADASITLERSMLSRLLVQQVTLTDAIRSGELIIDGDVGKLNDMFEVLDDFPFLFEILEPRQVR
jgi:alkyl sulfatase BDS1-like metallo-beta-lactamase superfamily hydrolase